MADDLVTLRENIRRAVCLGADCHHTDSWSQCGEVADNALGAVAAEIANLRADLKVKEIATDEAMAQGERQQAEIEGLRRALAADNEDVEYVWSLNFSNGSAYMSQVQSAMHRILIRHRALSQSPADLLAQREAEREVINAARNYFACESDENGLRLERALAALAEKEAGA